MAVYPNESWPTDSTVVAVDGTTDAGTGLPYIAKGTGPTSTPSYEVQYNRRQMRENGILASWRQGMVVDEGGLKVGVYPICYTIGGTRLEFGGASGAAVSDNSELVAYLDASAQLHIAADWPADPATYLPLAQIATLAGVVSIKDRRGYAVFCV